MVRNRADKIKTYPIKYIIDENRIESGESGLQFDISHTENKT